MSRLANELAVNQSQPVDPEKASFQRFGLAIHTTTPELGLAIGTGIDDPRAQTWNVGRSLSTHLQVYLQDFIQPLTWKDLSFLAVAKGPGSFTGTRMGVVTARTLAQQLRIPLFAISTSAALAWSVRSQTPKTHDIVVQIPAQRGEVFGSAYRTTETGELTTILADTAIPVAVWEHKLETWPNAYDRVESPPHLGASVVPLLGLAYWYWLNGERPSWLEALPFYGQHPIEG
ncbi:MAG: tRNA (adenosine(37)-N6)-threonylcarbamoyltransferase complex dimerization subunit type 1 TsaB [Leptolyngbyaceae cyanobacterium bins.59]|nr:tRNA (adenosine(37)-N6)-threonylcarbamoyltransferase complex dimerization subunit type 1 TsaB [Leptolyngbyaceae cyanobacterium bins.59]